MKKYELIFTDKAQFEAVVTPLLPQIKSVKAEDVGMGDQVPNMEEQTDPETGEPVMDQNGCLPGYFVNVLSEEAIPELVPFIINPLPTTALHKWAGELEEWIVMPE